jgi:Ca2+-binding RTX toxin-like protein
VTTITDDDPAPVAPTFTGTAAADTFTATSSANWTINGAGGNDTLSGAGGNDYLIGGDGDDRFLYTGAANGFDSIDGGAGVDRIVASGTNTVIGLTSTTSVPNSLTSITAIDGVVGGNTRISGSAGNDTMNFNGVTLNNIVGVDGGDGNDTLLGAILGDILLGGAGNDFLAGREGADRLTGGTGIDTFDYNANSELTNDRILDFISDAAAGPGLGDIIDLSGIDAGTATGNEAFTWIGSAAFSGAAGGQLRYFFDSATNSTTIQINTDADISSDGSLRLDGQIQLQATDFVL